MTQTSHGRGITDRFINGIPRNPLQRRSEAELMRDVTVFYEHYDFRGQIDSSELSLQMLKRGALVAQNPNANLVEVRNEETEDSRPASSPPDNSYRNAPPRTVAEQEPDRGNTDTQQYMKESTLILSNNLKKRTNIEDKALKEESEARLGSLTKDTIFIYVTCAFGALSQGCAQQALVGANLTWPIELGIAVSNGGPLDFTAHPSGRTKFALVNAISWFAASVCGAWLSDPLTFRYGRRGALFVAALCSFVSPIGAAYSRTWSELFLCRFVSGIGIGAKSSVIPVLESEIASDKMRGRLLVSWQTFTATGIAITAATDCIFHGSWRSQVGVTCVSAIPLLLCCVFIPESPHWLIKKRRYPDAFRVLRRLRPTTLQAARDLYRIYVHVRTEQYLFSEVEPPLNSVFESPECEEPKFWSRFPMLLKPRNRRAVFAAWSVMTAQQLSAINIFAFLATTIFDATHVNPMKNLWFDFGFGLINALASASAYFLIDRLGRRAMMLYSLMLMIPFLFAMASQSADPGFDHQTASAVLLILFTAAYSFGAGVIPPMYASEIFPVMYREVGMSLTITVNFAFAGLLDFWVSKSVRVGMGPEEKSNVPTILYIFGGLTIFAIFLVWFFMRAQDEPASKESYDALFLAHTSDYHKYLLSEELARPFRFAKFVFGMYKDGKRPPNRSFSRWLEARQDSRAMDEEKFPSDTAFTTSSKVE